MSNICVFIDINYIVLYYKKMNKNLLIFSVFIIASCGLAYELIMSALSSYLLGDSILQFSTIIGTYLFAMGIGAGLSKFIKDEDLIDKFIDIEILIGFIGGISAIILMLIFFVFSYSFKTSLYGLVFIIGSLVGMEIPIVIRLLDINGQKLKDMISTVLSFDYLGALFVSLMFPLVFMPYLGINKTAIFFGFSNLVVSLLTLKVLGKQLKPKNQFKKIIFISISVILLSGLLLYSEKISNFAEKGIYGNEIIYSKMTKYQKLFITKHKDDIRLFINGNLQFSTRDEHRYHEALVHPILQSHPNVKNVLVLGGGDGLALREILKKDSVENITLIDLDKDMTDLFTNNSMLTAINKDSFKNKKVKVINEDASKWLQNNSDYFDIIIIDFPDPSNYSLGKLYSTSFYSLVEQHLSDNGLGVIQSTSPYFAPHVYWTVYATLKSVNLKVNPYHIYVPSFGDWGFFVISKHGFKIPTIDPKEFKYINNEIMKNMFLFPKDMPQLDMPPNTLNNQNVVENFTKDWESL